MPESFLSVIGSGLIGASISMAIKRRRPWCKVTCFDLEEKLESITQAEVADHVSTIQQGAHHLEKSELVIVATPTGTIIPTLREIAAYLAKGAVILDVGSTKSEIMAQAQNHLPPHVHFVGGHPLAGSEKSGAAAADPLMFNDKPFVLCPHENTPPEVMLCLIDFVEALGAVPITIDPDEHDRLLALISHLPHLVAVALMLTATKEDASHQLLHQMVGPSFLEMTRVAASSPEVWQSIIDTNRQAIDTALDSFMDSMKEIRLAMDRGNLSDMWDQASQARRSMTPDTIARDRKPDLRYRIDRCDAQLLKTLAERMRIVKRIGVVKRNLEDPVGDPKREKKMRQSRMSWAEQLSLSPNLVGKLFDVIVEHSRRIQE